MVFDAQKRWPDRDQPLSLRRRVLVAASLAILVIPVLWAFDRKPALETPRAFGGGEDTGSFLVSARAGDHRLPLLLSNRESNAEGFQNPVPFESDSEGMFLVDVRAALVAGNRLYVLVPDGLVVYVNRGVASEDWAGDDWAYDDKIVSEGILEVAAMARDGEELLIAGIDPEQTLRLFRYGGGALVEDRSFAPAYEAFAVSVGSTSEGALVAWLSGTPDDATLHWQREDGERRLWGGVRGSSLSVVQTPDRVDLYFMVADADQASPARLDAASDESTLELLRIDGEAIREFAAMRRPQGEVELLGLSDSGFVLFREEANGFVARSERALAGFSVYFLQMRFLHLPGWLFAIGFGITVGWMAQRFRERRLPPLAIRHEGAPPAAPLWRRLLAFFVDVNLAFLFADLAVRGLLDPAGADYMNDEAAIQGTMTPTEMAPAAQSALQARILLMTFLMIAYHAIAEACFGRSLGKWLMSLRVVDLQGAPAGPMSCVVRSFFRSLDLMLLVVSFLFVLVSRQRQRLGDIVAGTMVTGPVRRIPKNGNDEENDKNSDSAEKPQER